MFDTCAVEYRVEGSGDALREAKQRKYGKFIGADGLSL